VAEEAAAAAAAAVATKTVLYASRDNNEHGIGNCYAQSARERSRRSSPRAEPIARAAASIDSSHAVIPRPIAPEVGIAPRITPVKGDKSYCPRVAADPRELTERARGGQYPVALSVESVQRRTFDRYRAFEL